MPAPPQPPKRSAWLLWFGLMGIILIAALFIIINRQYGTDSGSNAAPVTETVSPKTNETPATTPVESATTSAQPAATAVTAGTVGINTVDKDSNVHVYYYDPTTNQITKQLDLGLQSDLGGGIGDNDKVQYTPDGDFYVFKSEMGGMGGPGTPPEYAQITRYSDKKVVLRGDGVKELFSGWLLSADAKTIYVLMPIGEVTSDNAQPRDLYALNTTSLSLTKLATFGLVNTPLYTTGDRQRLYAVESRSRKENDKYLYDLYLKIYNLTTNKFTEKQLYKDDGVYSFPSITGVIRFGPNLLKGAYDNGLNGRYTLRTIDVNTQKVTDLFDFGGSGQMDAEWSPDGQKLLFAVTSLGTVPTQQGVFLYDYTTNQATQLIKTDITKQDNVFRKEAHLQPNSFDGDSFYYTLDDRGTIYHYTIATQKTNEFTLPADSGVQTYADSYFHRY